MPEYRIPENKSDFLKHLNHMHQRSELFISSYMSPRIPFSLLSFKNLPHPSAVITFYRRIRKKWKQRARLPGIAIAGLRSSLRRLISAKHSIARYIRRSKFSADDSEERGRCKKVRFIHLTLVIGGSILRCRTEEIRSTRRTLPVRCTSRENWRPSESLGSWHSDMKFVHWSCT